MTPFRIKPGPVAIPISEQCFFFWRGEHVSFSNEGPLLETLECFEIGHCSYQPLNCLPFLEQLRKTSAWLNFIASFAGSKQLF